ncbi:MAG: hypothetical protein ABI566_03685 [Pseudolysinimonas sp.]
MSEGRLIRRLLPFERNYTSVPNEWLRDKRLSLQARGLLAMLMTHKDGFRVSINGLARDGHGGVDRVRSAVGELEAVGYLIRRPRRRAGTGDDWELADPTGLSDPALFGYAGLGSTPGGRKIQPHLRGVGKSDPVGKSEGNGSENPTPIKNTKKTINPGLPSNPSTRAENEDERPAGAHVPSADEWHEMIREAHGRALPAARPACPARKSLPCSITSEGKCLDCGMTPEQLVAHLALMEATA